MNERRCRDPDAQIWDGNALVVCPRCAGAARACGRSVRCGHCGFSRLPHELRYTGGTATLVHTVWHPRCSKCGVSLPKAARTKVQASRTLVSVRCKGCGHSGHYPVRPEALVSRLNHDSDSGLPYFLCIAVGPHILWVRNLDHLDLIEAYVKATLRERPLQATRMTLLARLPAWIKSAGNRDDLLRAIKNLRARATNAGLA